MFRFAWQAIRGRAAGFAGAFIAVCCAAAVITATGVLVNSGLFAGIPPERYAGATVVVGAPQYLPVPDDNAQHYAERVPMPATLVDRIARVPGVRTAVGDVSVPVGLRTTHGLVTGPRLLAHGWSAAALGPFTLTSGRAPRAADEIVLDAGLAARAGVATGNDVDLLLGGVPTHYRVVGVAAPPPTGLARQSAIFLSDDQARRVSGRPNQVDTVGVLAATGVSPGELAGRIAAAVPGVVTYTGNARADAEFLDVGGAKAFLIELAGAFGGTMVLVVLFVVCSTFGLAIQQRRREFAVLRAIAATPRQVHGLIGAETVLLGSIAAAVGTLPGIWLSYLLRDAFAGAGAIPADFRFAIGPLPPLAAIVVCVGATRLAGYVVARRAARISPVDALGEAAVEPPRLGRVRLVVGCALVLIALAVSIIGPLAGAGPAATAGAASAALLLVLATGLLGPRLLTMTAHVLDAVRVGRRGIGGFLAGANTRANARRLAAATTPLIMGVTLGAVQLFTMTTVAAAAQHQASAGITADYVVTDTAGGLAPSIADVVRNVPGVAAVTPVARTQVLISYPEAGHERVDPYQAQGVTAAGLGDLMNLNVTRGDIADLTGDTVALSRTAAGTAGAGIGARITMHLGDGTAISPRVVAIYGSGLGFGDVTLPHDTVVAHTTDRLDTAILVRATAAADLRGALRGYPTVAVADRAAFTAAQNTAQAAQDTVSLILDAVILGYLVIAVANTLVMATLARGREFALLRLVGATRRQVHSMMRGEAVIVIVAAIGLGTLAAIPPLVGISVGLTGSPVPVVPPLAYLGIVAGSALLGWSCLTIPARLAMRQRPVTAIGVRE